MERSIQFWTHRFNTLLLSGVFVWMGAAQVLATSNSEIIFHRDAAYEQDLKIIASPDQTITPARVLRWLGALMAHTSFAPSTSSTEFEPIINVDNTHIRVVAALAYKF